MSRQLLQICKNIPLPKLKQGSTLSIKSQLPISRVTILPEWRDDGSLSMTQWLPSNDSEAHVSVTHELDKMTSLGRAESHLSVAIFQECSTKSPSDGEKLTAPSSATDTSTILGKVEEPLIITDDGDIVPDSDEWHGSNVKRVEYTDGITHVSTKDSSSDNNQEPSLTLTAVIPEKCNIACELLEGGDVVIDKKVEGDVSVKTVDGDVRVNKLRGHKISISAQGVDNTILATDLLEAQRLDIDTRGRVRAKKVHGSQVNMQVDRQDCGTHAHFVPTNDVDDEGSLIDISSLYAGGNGSAHLYVSSGLPPEKRAVRIKSNHGHVSVETNVPHVKSNDPCVELGGVNGSFDVAIQNSPTSQGLVGRIHVDSLSKDSVSVLSADAGDVSLTFDRKAEADVRMLSSNEITSFDTRAALLEDDNPSQVHSALRDLDAKSERTSGDSKLRIETDAFTARTTENAFENIDYVDGWVENKSNEPDSRLDLMSKGGKIQLQGAAEQALQGFSSADKGHEIARPLVTIATNGKITLESLSWFGAIARRYGLEEERDDLGRTATRSGRPLVPKE
jgi:hypothetical protein